MTKVITIILEGDEIDPENTEDFMAGLEEGVQEDLVNYDTGFNLKSISIHAVK